MYLDDCVCVLPDLTWLPLLGVGRKSWYIIIIRLTWLNIFIFSRERKKQVPFNTRARVLSPSLSHGTLVHACCPRHFLMEHSCTRGTRNFLMEHSCTRVVPGTFSLNTHARCCPRHLLIEHSWTRVVLVTYSWNTRARVLSHSLTHGTLAHACCLRHLLMEQQECNRQRKRGRRQAKNTECEQKHSWHEIRRHKDLIKNKIINFENNRLIIHLQCNSNYYYYYYYFRSLTS